MKTVKTIKQGNSVTIPVPKSLNIPPGKEFIVVKEDDGAFMYLPKEENIFKEAYKDNLDLRVEDDLENDEPVGRELN